MSNSKNNTTSYLIKNMDSKLWRDFRATAMIKGYASAKDCLIHLIERYSQGYIGD